MGLQLLGAVSIGAARTGLPDLLSHFRVDADGVPCEWVEATRATRGQETIVYFLGGEHGVGPLERYRPSALEFAIATGARILTVACGGAVEDGLAAYVWLLGEGCDTKATAFTDPVGGTLAAAVLEAGNARGLPLPSAGVWLSGCSPASARTGVDVHGRLQVPER